MKLDEITQSPLTRPKEESDIDLVQAVHSVMVELSYPLASAWLEDPEIQEAVGKNTSMQRFLINRNLRIKLGASERQTSTVRFVLDANVTTLEYVKNMRIHVVPALNIILSDLH